MWIKVCGVTQLEDAELVVASGANAIGLNFVPTSRRKISVEAARALSARLSGRIELVGVVADLALGEATALAREAGLDWLQLHGEETPALVSSLLPSAYKALRVGGAEDVLKAQSFPGERLLVDAKVAGSLGGAGVAFDWTLVSDLVRQRAVIVAGGLNPQNVRSAVEQLHPWGLDVASGVERPGCFGRQDPERLRAFMAAARGVDP